MIKVWKKVLEIALEDPEVYKVTLSQVSGFALLSFVKEEQLELLECSMEFLEPGPLTYRLTEKIASSDTNLKRAAHVLLDIWKQTQMKVQTSKA